MSERSERLIVAAPKAHSCTTASMPDTTAHRAMVHQ